MSLAIWRIKQPVFLWCAGLTLIAIVLSVTSGFMAFWTDSEMWPVSATKYLFSTRPEYYFGTKPLFHFGLYLVQAFSQILEVHPMDVARAIMVFNSLGIILAVFLIMKHLAGPERAVLAVALLVALPVFIKRGGEVRSDLLGKRLWNFLR